jgi:hypothetical protein
MWRRVDLVSTDVSEERIASIFKVEKSASEAPAWAGAQSASECVELGSSKFSESERVYECKPSVVDRSEMSGLKRKVLSRNSITHQSKFP